MSTNPRVLNRWVIVVGALMMQLALGAIYAWSAFTKLLMESAGGYDFTASQAAWVFSASLAVFVIVMVYAGRWQARIGPRPVALLGGHLPGCGIHPRRPARHYPRARTAGSAERVRDRRIRPGRR